MHWWIQLLETLLLQSVQEPTITFSFQVPIVPICILPIHRVFTRRWLPGNRMIHMRCNLLVYWRSIWRIGEWKLFPLNVRAPADLQILCQMNKYRFCLWGRGNVALHKLFELLFCRIRVSRSEVKPLMHDRHAHRLRTLLSHMRKQIHHESSEEHGLFLKQFISNFPCFQIDF